MISSPVDPVLETQVAEVLQWAGLTTEAAVRMLFTHLAEHESMPACLTPPGVEPPWAVADGVADATIPAEWTSDRR